MLHDGIIVDEDRRPTLAASLVDKLRHAGLDPQPAPDGDRPPSQM
jgi:hypothetical protein